jgi:hypothetical protein
VQLPVVTLAPPAWLARLPLFKPLLILPDEQAAHWLRQGHLEFCLLLADPAQPDSVSAFADAVRTLLLVERRDTAQLQGPEVLLAEIAALETTRRRTQAAAGLEYRQTRYIVALLRSFGAPSVLILLRYAAEAVILLALAIAAHPVAFGFAGFEPGLLDRAIIYPYTWNAVWSQLRWLLAGAALSVAPIALALRQPVGKILQ